jgi:hypothetical protein
MSYTASIFARAGLKELFHTNKAALDMIEGFSLLIFTLPTWVGIVSVILWQTRWPEWWTYHEE